MVDSEYDTEDYKSSKTSSGALMKNPQIPILVPDHIKTKKTWKHAVKKLFW